MPRQTVALVLGPFCVSCEFGSSRVVWLGWCAVEYRQSIQEGATWQRSSCSNLSLEPVHRLLALMGYGHLPALGPIVSSICRVVWFVWCLMVAQMQRACNVSVRMGALFHRFRLQSFNVRRTSYQAGCIDGRDATGHQCPDAVIRSTPNTGSRILRQPPAVPCGVSREPGFALACSR